MPAPHSRPEAPCRLRSGDASFTLDATARRLASTGLLAGLILLACLAGLAGCSTPAGLAAAEPAPATPVLTDTAMLLVSLEDGTIIRQDIGVDADVCLKTIDDPATICFRRGEPIVQANRVVGYEMTRTEIDLYAN